MSQTQESKRYPRSARNFRFCFELFAFQERLPKELLFSDKTDGSSSFSDEMDESSFIEDLFNNEVSVKIRNAVKESTFIQGMADGTLAANKYGGYMVQDAAFCFKSVEALDYAAQQMQTQGKPELSQLYSLQSEEYIKYNKEFEKIWKLKSSDSVVMGPAAVKYVSYEFDISHKHPKYFCIAMLPCLMLWPWLVSELIDSVKTTNPYYHWFEEYKPNQEEKKKLIKFVSSFFAPDEMAKCQPIFNEGMVNELNFFRDACDETLYDYTFFNV